ncbi:MAG TPA: pyridoxamine 5'-phosphate oxidase family protein [Chitinophagaceae bacterium]|nr:pyridoxamine 5'-phosphate oxidase family protein [Chitinophagaceae bacterium]
MGKEHEYITEDHRAFIESQRMFFVCTSPLSAEGHINLSPKGFDCFRILSPTRVGYLDITGSGNETSAHLLENGRITFMFCAFDGPPKILRLYGKGFSVLPGDAEWDELTRYFTILPATRQIIVADIFKVKLSCGFGIPLYDYKEERDHAFKWAEKKGEDGLEEYKKEKNMVSMDGLPAPIAAKFI